MALTGNFISFPSVMESVYRRVGYQQVDLNDVVETIGETLRIIGVLPAFTDITTNGVGTNPAPIEIIEYKAQIPSEYVTLHGVRKVNLYDSTDEEGDPVKKIGSFNTMTRTTDIFYQSTGQQQRDISISEGIYSDNAIAIKYDITLVGSSGTLQIDSIGNLTKTVTFDTDLTTTASNYVTSNAAAYALVGIVLTSDEDSLVFTEATGGSGLIVIPELSNLTGDLNGIVERNDVMNGPVEVHSLDYQLNTEYEYTYKIDNGQIHTNFREGFVEMAYSGFVVDEDGFPMIPDDQRFIEAIKWTLIEHIDYKKWRLGEIPDKVYNDTEQKKAWYIGSAISKAAVPSPDEMNALKKMMLRSIPKVNEHDSYFKYTGIGEQRYNLNS